MTQPWHILTGEYPPQSGGLSDYTQLVAAGLVSRGVPVHVWTAGPGVGTEVTPDGVTVHRVGGFGPRGVWRLVRGLSAQPGPRRLLVQYVPQMYGFKGANLLVPLAALARSRRGDAVRVMFHEVFLGWRVPGRQKLLAAAQRAMLVTLTRAAVAADVSIPQWAGLVRAYAPRRLPVAARPVPANVPADADPEAVRAVRRRYAPTARLVGHFGTYGHATAGVLDATLAALLAGEGGPQVLLLGGGSDRFRTAWVARHPHDGPRLHATGRLDGAAVAAHLRACDLVVQPYRDGANGRRGSLMAALANGVAVVSNVGVATEGELAAALDAPSHAREMAAVGAELAATASALLADPARRAAAGDRGRELYEARYALRHTLDALVPPSGGG